MGRGKGAPSVKIFPLVPGTIIFEFKLLPQFQVSLLYRAIKFATLRLPFKTQILTKNGIFTDNFKNY